MSLVKQVYDGFRLQATYDSSIYVTLTTFLLDMPGARGVEA